MRQKSCRPTTPLLFLWLTACTIIFCCLSSKNGWASNVQLLDPVDLGIKTAVVAGRVGKGGCSADSWCSLCQRLIRRRTHNSKLISCWSGYQKSSILRSWQRQLLCRIGCSSFGMLRRSGCTCGFICRRGWRRWEGKLFCTSTWCDSLRRLIHIGAFGWHILR